MSHAAPSPIMTTLQLRLLLLAMVALVFLVYWPGLGGGFVFDDFPNIVNNPALHVTHAAWSEWVAAVMSSSASEFMRPLAMLTFALNHYFTGLDPGPMKLTNLSIHLLNTLLVFGLARSLLRALAPVAGGESRRDEWAALFAAACWGLHPINLMAVLYVVQRMESLCHAFVFAGLWIYVAARSRQCAGTGGLAMALFGLVPFTLLGMLAKESGALLPLYAFCIELFVFRFRGRDYLPDRLVAGMYVALLFLPAIAGGLWLLPKILNPAAFSLRDFNLTERLMTEPRVVLDYLRWILLPDPGQMSLSHDDYVISRGLWNPPATVFAPMVLMALIGVAWICRRRRPLVSLGLSWFLVAQVLTATVIPLELVFEHRNYFASLGICLLLADMLVRAPQRPAVRSAGKACAWAFLLICAGATCLRASEWRTPFSFAVTEAAKRPLSPRATYYLGWTLAEASQYRADSPLVQPAFDALERSRRLPDSNILPDQAALILAARTGTPLQAAWWQHMQARLREHPIGAQEQGALDALVNCAIDSLCRFPQDEVNATFAAAFKRGKNPNLLVTYGNYVLNVLGDPTLALHLWQEACALDPRESQYPISVAKLLIELGRYDEARSQISHLRAMGRFGQYDHAADALTARLKAVIESRDASPHQPANNRR